MFWTVRVLWVLSRDNPYCSINCFTARSTSEKIVAYRHNALEVPGAISNPLCTLKKKGKITTKMSSEPGQNVWLDSHFIAEN